jgi:hypothetical protein
MLDLFSVTLMFLYELHLCEMIADDDPTLCGEIRT